MIDSIPGDCIKKITLLRIPFAGGYLEDAFSVKGTFASILPSTTDTTRNIVPCVYFQRDNHNIVHSCSKRQHGHLVRSFLDNKRVSENTPSE